MKARVVLRLTTLMLIASPLLALPVDEARAQEPTKKNVWVCEYVDSNYVTHYAIVETALVRAETTRQFVEFSNGQGGSRPACYDRAGNYGELSYDSVQTAQINQENRDRNWTTLTFTRFNWTPAEVEAVEAKRKRKSVFFRAPDQRDDGRGYSNATFDIEYQFIACMGELHIAYSVLENSVRQKTPTYFYEGAWHSVSPPSPEVLSVPIRGVVYIPPFHNEPIGEFGDNAAAKALGWGCFTGQTKKVADLKDHVGPNASKDKVQAFMDKLDVTFRTSEVLKSTSAEQEIREGKAAKTSAPKEGRAEADAGPSEAELRAQRRAEKEAEFQAATKKYQEDLAKQQEAVAQFNAATEQVAAEKAAQAERVRAAQQAYAAQKAAHDAEMERHRQQQAEYERTVAAPARIKKPN